MFGRLTGTQTHSSKNASLLIRLFGIPGRMFNGVWNRLKILFSADRFTEIPEHQNQPAMLDDLMSELAQAFLIASAGDVRPALEAGLRSLAGTVSATGVALVHCDGRIRNTSTVYECSPDGDKKMTRYVQNISAREVRLFCSELQHSGEIVRISDSVLSAEKQQIILENLSAKNVIAVPLKGNSAGGACLLLGFDDERFDYSEHGFSALKSIANMFFIMLDRESVQNTLHARQELLLENQHMARLGSWVLDSDTSVLNCTPEVYRIFGIDESVDVDFPEFIGMVHDEDKEETGKIIQHAIQTHGAYHFTYRIITPSGEIKHIEGRGQAVFDERGQFLRRVGSVMDVTDRVESEDRLKISSIMFESTAEGVIITDKNSVILAVNKAFSEITGYDEKEAIGDHPALLKSGRHDNGFYERMFQGLDETGHWQGEIWNRRKGGEYYPEWLTITNVYNDDKELINRVAVFSDISRLKKSEQQLEHMSMHDALTNLPNRSLFQSRLSHALDIARRNQYKVAVLYIDLDHFKNINDSLGHPVGDELLIKASQRLKNRIRESDTLARIGGDEFVLLLEQIENTEQPAYVSRSVLELLSESFCLDNGQEVFIGASIGVSIFPDDSTEATELISHADAALYKAKDQGRNNVQFYTSELTEAAQDRLQLENELRRALTLPDELELYFQPQVDMRSGDIIGAEALLRWNHPKDGVVSPARFLPVAEKSGLMAAMDYWVFEKACTQHKQWQNEGLPGFILAINITRYSFTDPDFISRIKQIMEQSGVDPRTVEMEITEGALIEPSPEVIQTISELKGLGFTLAIDDFGTGYSSLAYLQKFNVDKLKIDRSFVKDVMTDAQGEAITTAIISLAKSLDLSILAEGVEDPDQLELLTEKGCDAYQGFYFSKPVPATEFADLMQAYKP